MIAELPKYKIVVGDKREVEQTVEVLLAAKWELGGSAFINLSGQICQPMVYDPAKANMPTTVRGQE